MIRPGSRYDTERRYAVHDPDRADEPLDGFPPHEPARITVRRLHRVVAGERLDQLAQRYYGDPSRYWLICDANDALFPDELMVPGRVLRIPRNRP